MSRLQLKGMGVAVVTPFKADKSIDFDSLGRLLDYQIESGADFLTILGTTAESVTLSSEERLGVTAFAVDHVAGRVPLILGFGGNNTAELVRELGNTDFRGYSAILSVVPFYNKPSQEGIYQHYRAVAEASPVPVILYNVPGRTGTNMTASTTLRVAADCPNVIAIKEASGNIAQIEEIIRNKPEGFTVLSGDDASTCKLLSLGASGVISVIGNAFPERFSRMVRLALNGSDAEAQALHDSLVEMFHLMSVDGNPSGIKCLLSLMGLVSNELRLPLVPVTSETSAKISRQLEIIGKSLEHAHTPSCILS